MDKLNTLIKRTAFILFFFLPLFVGAICLSATGNDNSASIRFTENKNQFDSHVLFEADLIKGGKLFLEKNTFTYLFWNPLDIEQMHHPRHPMPTNADSKRGLVHYHSFKASFLNSNLSVIPQPDLPFPDYKNYYIGNDVNKWASEVHSFASVVYPDLYPLTDMHVYSLGSHLKYDFIVREGGHPDLIRIAYSGADKVFLHKGILYIQTSLGEITEQKPYSYQVIEGKKVTVACRFLLTGNVLSFIFPNGYDLNTKLVIDPTLIVSTFSGSAADNWGFTATYDAAGNIYAGGIASTQGYPTTAGAFQLNFAGGGPSGGNYPFDISITKYNPSGSALLYSTYLGGSDNEQPQSILVDNTNSLLVMGRTYSNNFPVTAGAFQGNNAGGSDIVVTKFNSSGTALLGSTYIGGRGDDGVNISADFLVETSLKYNYGDDGRSDIVTDISGNYYIASSTQSPDFPTSANTFQKNFRGGTQDGCVFKLNNSLSALVWSTYLGGNNNDACYSLVLDAGNNVYVSGGTNSTDFPITAGALITSFQGGTADGFVTHLNNNGSAVLQSTYIGTSAYDQSYFVQVDKNYNVYLFGQTEGAYPVSGGVYFNRGSSQFIHKLNPTLSTTFYSTVFGSGLSHPNISPSAFMVDTCENVYTSGWGGQCIPYGFTGTTNGMPVTSNAFQSTTDGCDFYFFVLKKNAVSLWYASFFGGSGGTDEHVDGGTSRFDKNGVIYQSVCAGCGGSSNFPTTAGAWSTTNNSTNCNNAVIKLAFQLLNLHAVAAALTDTMCIGSLTHFTNLSTGAVNYIWNFGDGSPVDTNKTPSHLYTAPGKYTVTLQAIDSSSCKVSDATQLVVMIAAPPVVNIGSDTLSCGTVNMTLDAGNPGAHYLWSTGAGTQMIQASSPGTYWVKVNRGPCFASDTMKIGVLSKPDLGKDTTLCQGLPLTLYAGQAGGTYLWSTGLTTQNIAVNTSGTYWVDVNAGACHLRDSVIVNFNPPPVIALGNDTVLCSNASLILDAGNPGSVYLWNTGASSQIIHVSSSGLFKVTVTKGGCTRTDSLKVTRLSAENLGPDQFLCGIQPLRIDAGYVPNASYHWSTGDSTQIIEISDSGHYWVRINTGICILTDTIFIDGGLGGAPGIFIPNAFTPNADGLNDVFQVKGIDVTRFDMKIFNRWGELFFESKDLNKGWDGTYAGQLVPNDIYVWVIEYSNVCSHEQILQRVGHVLVDR
jgi:gliding motility-associated-like protein